MATKTYVLLSHMDAEAPVYQTTADGQRSQIKKIPFYHVPRRYSFTDKDGIGRVIRYKANSKFIDQEKQVEMEKIAANEPFSSHEKRDTEFRFGVLTTNKVRAQEYLESTPEFHGFTGFSDEVREPRYKLLDEAVEAKIQNAEIRKRVKAASKVLDMELEDLQAMIIRINGSFVSTPDNKEDCENMLMSFIDDTNEEGLDAVLKEDKDVTVDDKTGILIGKLLNKKLLAFDVTKGVITKKGKDGKQVEIRTMSAEYPMEEWLRLFSDFLNSTEGKVLREDLEKDLKESNKKTDK